MEREAEFHALENAFSEIYTKLLSELDEFSRFICKKQKEEEGDFEEINKMLKEVNKMIQRCLLQVTIYTTVLEQGENVKKLTECMTELLKQPWQDLNPQSSDD